MKIKLQTVLEIMTELKKLENVEASADFSYAAMKNLVVVEEEAEILKKIATKPLEGGEAYKKERQELVDKYVGKDDAGHPMTQKLDDGQHHYIFEGDNKSKFLKAIELLDETFSNYIKDVEARQKELDKLVEKKVDVEFKQVELKYFPNKISPRQMRVLSPMLNEGKDDK